MNKPEGVSKGLDGDGNWAQAPEKMIDDNLYNAIKKGFDKKCNSLHEAEYSVELLDKVEEVRRTGTRFIKALYELNNSREINAVHKISPCLDNLVERNKDEN